MRRNRVSPAVSHIPVKQTECEPSPALANGRELGRVPTSVFFAATALYTLVGCACIYLPPRPATEAAGVPMPPEAVCLRVQRKATHIVVELALGAPPRTTKALVRFDRVVAPASSGASTLRVFSSRAIESAALSCDGVSSVCTDVLILARGDVSATPRRAVVKFDHVVPAVEEASYGVAMYHLQLEAELLLQRGKAYWLTANHLCWIDKEGDVEAEEGDLVANVTELGALATTLEDMGNLEGITVPPELQNGECAASGLEQVDVFPGIAAHEASYLGITDLKMYDDGKPKMLTERRHVVELGVLCASSLARHARHYALWLVDCVQTGGCRSAPSLPFRRAATSSIYMHVSTAGPTLLRFSEVALLKLVPGLSDAEYAVWLAIGKLALMLLAAATLWIRADRVTASAHWLFKHCISLANGRCDAVAPAVTPFWEDAALGLLCTGARIGVAAWRLSYLSQDAQTRVGVVELVAGGMSAVHWFARWFLLQPSLWRMAVHGERDDRGPLTRLGGSSAIIDAAMAVLLLYAQPPLLRSEGNFDETARLLMGMLVVLVAAQRVWYSAACCGVIFEAGDRGVTPSNASFQLVLLLSTGFWLAQSCALAVGVADLVSTPLAYGLARTLTGSVEALALGVYMLLVGLGLPRLTATAVKLVRR